MKQKYQITITCGSGAYKPISTLIEVEQSENVNLLLNPTEKKKIINKGVQKICASRYWTSSDLKRYSYDKVKIRIYNKEEIEKEQKERYEKLKEEKYASGEWKRPKKKEESI